LATYACADAYLCLCLYEKLFPMTPLKMQGLVHTEMDLIPIVAEIERQGIKLDLKVLGLEIKNARTQKKEHLQKLYEIAGEEFNPNSYPQLCQILEKLSLAEQLKDDTSKITTKEENLKLVNHPFINHLLEYRESEKLIQQAENLIKASQDSIIRTNFDQLGTRTGRFSSSSPNLQNVNPELRGAFIARKGCYLVSFDYSQIELRILAELSNCQKMQEAFKSGKDLHQFTASLVYNLPEDQITDQQRKDGKNVNFAVIYGMGGKSLARKLQINEEQAQNFLNNFFTQYPEVNQLRSELEQQILSRSGFFNPYGRWLMLEPTEKYRALNYLIQSTAADLLKESMVRVGRFLEDYASKILLTIHDELVLEIPENELDLIPKIKELIEISPFQVPIEVSVEIGKNWSEMVPYDEWLDQKKIHFRR